MNVHEFQAKALLARFGVVTPHGRVAATAEEAEAASRDVGGPCVLKAQVHAGGRGKAGGIRKAETPEDARRVAGEMIGMSLVTAQTGSHGRTVRRLLVEEILPIRKEYYAAVTLDRAQARPVLMASTEGGVEIEGVAHQSPEKIHRVAFDPLAGLQPFQARGMAYALGMNGELAGKAAKTFLALASAFLATDASLVEINPLVVTEKGEVLALDAKVNLDDNALFRHKDLEALRDPLEEDPREVEAKKFDLSYIGLDGTIGCLVNGAGLAMSTMDIIKLCGGEPANFLDVGGGASKEKVAAAFKILLVDPRVKAIFVNIFGGILRCDVLAQGIVEAAREMDLKVPLVVRLEGTNVEEGRRILASSGLKITSAGSMREGAERAVAAASGAAA